MADSESTSNANVEEAQRALELGKKALDAGNHPKAISLLQKSLRMHVASLPPSLAQPHDGDSRQTNLRSHHGDGVIAHFFRRKTAEAEALLGAATRSTARAQAKDDPVESAPPARGHTDEQAQGVHMVLRAKTHYEVLSVHSEADDATIKRAYRKMALQFHPDKNAAPKAEEAFKKISKAFAVLSDPQARAHYGALYYFIKLGNIGSKKKC